MTPEELEKLPKPLERIMSALELSIMQEVVERIRDAVKITPTTDFMLDRLVTIGASKKKIKQQIRDALADTDISVDEIYEQAANSDSVRNQKIYEDAGMDYIPYKDNLWMQQLVDAVKRQTKDALRPMENITKTTGFRVRNGNKKVFTPLSEYMERSLDKAMMEISTGIKSYDQAIGEVIDEMTASGIRTVDYASGRSDRIEVAARRAVMTGVAQMTDKVNERNAEILRTDYWEVDWHMGARNTGTGYLNHQSWQGKVYTTEEMKTVCGLGEMLGFAGINCYHIRFPFIPGISTRKYTDEWLGEQNRKENEKKTYRGREYDTYAALQHQRALERTIRKRKQDAELLKVAGADKDELVSAGCRLRAVGQEYVRFSKEMGLRQQRERLRVGKIQELNKNSIVNSTKTDIMITGARITDPIGDKADAFAKMYYEEIRNFSTDSKKIADNLGKKESDIRKIKAYLFEEKSLIDPEAGQRKQFDPDCAIAQSWQRLMLGTDIKPHDRTLIEHELLEMEIKQKNPSMEHWKAHEMATKKHNYSREAEEYYGNLKEHKKNR